MEEGRANWAELLQELLAEIGALLKKPDEVSRFRAVCRKWRISVPPPNLKLVPTIFPPHVAVFLIQPLAHPSKAWISTVKVGELRLLYPLKESPAENLPVNFLKPIDLRYFNVTLLSGSCNFSAFNSMYDTTNMDINLLVNDHLMHIMTGSCGDRDKKYGAVCYFTRVPYVDFNLFKGMVCAIDRTGRLYEITTLINGMPKKTIVDVPVCDDSGGAGIRHRMVESFGELYLIVRTGASDGDVRFRVYKLNEVESKWDEVHNLGDRLLFIGFALCFFVSARDIPGCEPNCIVFQDYSLFCSDGGGFFQRPKMTIEIGVYQLRESDNFGLVSSHIGISELLWPPPSWLWPESCLDSRNPHEEQGIKPDHCSMNALVEGQEKTLANACPIEVERESFSTRTLLTAQRVTKCISSSASLSWKKSGTWSRHIFKHLKKLTDRTAGEQVV